MLALQLSKPRLLLFEGIRESHPVGYCGRLSFCGWLWRRRSSHGTAPALAVFADTHADQSSKAEAERAMILRGLYRSRQARRVAAESGGFDGLRASLGSISLRQMKLVYRFPPPNLSQP